jgi:hypothetical protein
MSKFDKIHLETMTTNERLCAIGLYDEMERSVKNKDFTRMREILLSIYIDEPSIDLMIRQAKYQ